MDFVASSQPLEDEDFWTVGTSQPFEDEVDLLPSVPPADIVATCQPKGTEEEWQVSTLVRYLVYYYRIQALTTSQNTADHAC